MEAIEPPLTVLEALSSGVPVLTTDTYSVDEVVTSGKNGFVVDPTAYGTLVDRAVEILMPICDSCVAGDEIHEEQPSRVSRCLSPQEN